MIRLGILLCAVISIGSLPPRPRDEAQNENSSFSVYLTAEYIQQQGYVVEKHDVTTEDGYILGMYRIPFGRYKTEAEGDRPVIFLMHGLYSASIAYIALGHEYSIAYNFADAGFDVWMGNARGSKDSRSHVTLDPDTDTYDFFNFSWEEIGMYDVAVMVDYVLEKTGKEKLHYIGHSQGGTVFLVLNSMRPEYNEKFASAHLLAGVGYQEHFPNEQLVEMAGLTDLIYSVVLNMGLMEIYPPNATGTGIEPNPEYTAIDYCLGDVSLRYVCRAIGMKDLLSGFELESFFQSNDAVGGGSLKQMAHYGQNIRDKQFRRFHYGSNDNQEIYGTPEPAAYDLSLVTVNTVMHYTISDVLLDERDVLAMAEVMPNTVTRKVARDSFLHEDFAAATDAKQLVTKFMVEEISKVEGYDYNNIFDESQEEINEEENNENNQNENEESDENEENNNQENDQNEENDQNNDESSESNDKPDNEENSIVEDQNETGNEDNDQSGDGINSDDTNDNDSTGNEINPPIDAVVVDNDLTSSSYNVAISAILQMCMIAQGIYLLKN